jgi:hypothetical protein
LQPAQGRSNTFIGQRVFWADIFVPFGAINTAGLFEHQELKLGGAGPKRRHVQEDGGKGQSKGHVDSPRET